MIFYLLHGNYIPIILLMPVFWYKYIIGLKWKTFEQFTPKCNLLFLTSFGQEIHWLLYVRKYHTGKCTITEYLVKTRMKYETNKTL